MEYPLPVAYDYGGTNGKGMKKKTTNDGLKKFRKAPFSLLVEKDSELSDLRREYSSKSQRERRMAADIEYHSQMANEIFNNALAIQGKEGLGVTSWPSGIVALTIDPLFAPAILTVGSIEYQVGRVEEAMKLFMMLTALPEDEEDLSIILDKAGDFLIDQNDYENALALYSAAEKAYPHEIIYLEGSGYCLGKLGRYQESVDKHRRMDALEPNNYRHLNDLGYLLFEWGKLDEAEEVLKRSISLSPPDYERSRNNLNLLHEHRFSRRF